MVRKYASIYFLFLLIPATLAGLFGVVTGIEFLLTPSDSGDPDAPNYHFLYAFSIGLSLFIIVGWFFVPGYVRQAFKRGTVSDKFWKHCAVYNAVLFAAALVFLHRLGTPPVFDAPMLWFMASIATPPILGFVLSCFCQKNAA